jgi:lipopolysaccharide/colanic/teichoic acid biosynthesis glycosyltransferase
MRKRRLPSSKSSLTRRLAIDDLLVAFFAPLLAFWLREAPFPADGQLEPYVIYLGAAICFSAWFFVQFRLAHGLPEFFSLHDALQIVRASGCAATATVVLLFTLTRLELIPRSIPPLHFLTLTAGLIGLRVLRRAIGQRREVAAAIDVSHDKERGVIIVGAGRLAWFYIRLLDTFVADNRRIVGILDEDKSLHGRSIFGHVVLGDTGEASALLDDLSQHGIDVRCFIICERDRAKAERLSASLKTLCLERGLDLEILAERIGIYSAERAESLVDNQSGDGYSLTKTSSGGGNAFARLKRLIEPVLAVIFMLALSPLFALAGLLVAIGLGAPVLFWQRRIGRNGRAIYIYKFKSMRNPVDASGRRLTDVERLTSVGRFLRATRLDELPQLFNVVTGDMALVGPRPLLLVDQPAEQSVRLSVAPGLTGWAQIHGGKLVTAEEKNALDEWYVRNASLRLDIAILLRTLVIVLTGDQRNEDRLSAALAQALLDKSKKPHTDNRTAVISVERVLA